MSICHLCTSRGRSHLGDGVAAAFAAGGGGDAFTRRTAHSLGTGTLSPNTSSFCLSCGGGRMIGCGGIAAGTKAASNALDGGRLHWQSAVVLGRESVVLRTTGLTANLT